MKQNTKDNFEVTPWQVKGKVNYNKLINEFGVSLIDDKLLSEIKSITKESHYLLNRKIFFAHRNLDWILEKYKKGEKFFLYTGRGPSGKIHLGHLIPMIFTKWLQEKFDTILFIQLTDDEKYLFKRNLDLKTIKEYTMNNIIDLMALGFNPDKTFFIIDTVMIKELYPTALKIARKINFSNVKAVFGMNNESNIGQIFYTSIQAVPAVLPSVWLGRNIPCLIPHGIDQDPHFRIARDVLPKIGFYKPASIESKFMSSLKEGDKMSSSDKDSAIFLDDSPEEVKRKISRAITGGRETAALQREKGGFPDKCAIYDYYKYLFEPDEKELMSIRTKCLKGTMLCGEDKKNLIDKINQFLRNHREKREKVRKTISNNIITEDNLNQIKEKVKREFN